METTKIGLHSLDLPMVIETSDVDFAEEFYNPALRNATEYKRGVGYFSSEWFRFASRGLTGLAENEGVAKWLISPVLSEGDWEALQKGEKAKQDPALYAQLDEMVSDLEEDLETETLNTIAWMIADGLLNIKIVIPGGGLSGSFHDKWGIVTDENGDKLGFHGSQNDSRRGFNNYESYSVFIGWESDRDLKRIEQHEARFDAIWENDKQGVHAITLPDSIALDIVQLREPNDRPYNEPSNSQKLQSVYRWRHQEEALNVFLAEGSGILDMATGTGKTKTSKKIAIRLLRNNAVENIVVATYGNDLLNQWYDTLVREFDPTEIRLYRQHGGHKQMGSFFARDRDQLEALIITYDELADCIDADRNGKLEDCLLICDEVHNIGSPARRQALRGELDVFPYRLGLSATPMDAYDEDRNAFIRDEVGPIVYEFTLEDAIRRGILCELDYTPLTYELSDRDKEKQQEQFGKFAGLKKQNSSIPQSQLYIMLARVRKESTEKLPEFRRYLDEHPEVLEDCLIFVETKDYGEQVQELVHEHTRRYRTYYGEDDEQNLVDFSRGEIDTLVTSRAISEGIDIKSVRNIVLFTSPRSKGITIQRIGRALRTAPEDPDKRANIVDFVVESDIEEDTVKNEDEITPPDKERYEWLTDLSTVTKEEP
ncbi:Superfamily II DNA or RNA helicase [Halogranum amylolyticum]|uniref:Superfamily II DNA or RNA helicase n=1 Tax=Halogranum amylolyticum TaxID=660520 RepID=A0A1H8WUT3_9EURY|nr:DEAD/DEAH box helicase family protein [Halogranum amylolyticum]SEP31444.1 Superfamily II DNA or RNA helicase [Halogranum amylolyticum]